VKVIRLRSRLTYLDDPQIWWGTQNPHRLCLILWIIPIIVSDRAVFLSSSVYMCKQTKDLKNKRNATDNSTSIKEIQRTIQRNYPYQEKGQRSWLKLLGDFIYAGTLLQRLSNDCLYKEPKTWRRITTLCILLCHYSVKLNSPKHLGF